MHQDAWLVVREQEGRRELDPPADSQPANKQQALLQLTGRQQLLASFLLEVAIVTTGATAPS